MPRVALADLLGRRVVVRRVVERSTAGTRYADVVGVLVAADPGRLAVRRADGSVHAVDLADVHRVKPVRPAPADILALEEVAALGWPAPDAEWLGRWLLRAAGGWTGRANSVLPLGDPGLALDPALAEVAAWYGARGLRPRFQLPLPARAPLGDALAARGWTAYNPTAVLTADVEVTLAALADRADLPPVLLEPVPSAGWLGAYHYRGGTELPPFAVRVMTAAERPVFASVTDGGTVAAIARGVLDRGWLGVTAVEVAASHRRQGLATHIMRALLDWASRGSATRGSATGGSATGGWAAGGWAAGDRAVSAYLQVAEENEAALAFYERLRFARHHRYQYVLAPEEA